MGTTADKLARLNETKALLKTRLAEKGLDVASENNFYNLVNAISQIQGAESIIGECFIKDSFGALSHVPIYRGFAPLDALAIFNTKYDVEPENAANAEYISWAALKSGNYVFYRGVTPGDTFTEKLV